MQKKLYFLTQVGEKWKKLIIVPGIYPTESPSQSSRVKVSAVKTQHVRENYFEFSYTSGREVKKKTVFHLCALQGSAYFG